MTDGHPTSLRYIVDPLYSALTGKSEPRPLLRVPPAFMVGLATVFATLSSLIGKRFTLPFWGMTPMEAKKVSLRLPIGRAYSDFVASVFGLAHVLHLEGEEAARVQAEGVLRQADVGQ